MYFKKPIPQSKLEKYFLDQIESDTPEKIKKNNLIDLNTKTSLIFTLTKENLDPFSENSNGLGIRDWFKNYEKEAKISTAGIRGLQNPLYPWDTRYPINLIGLLLATYGKAMVAKSKGKSYKKIAANEVRYNSSLFVELIARIQAAYGIKTYLTDDYKTLPIWMESFLIFMLDFYGGEHVTASHALAKKTATKDLNTQGSQYIPSESLLFVEEVRKLLDKIDKEGSAEINISATDHKLIDRNFLKSVNYGVPLYADYLRNSIASEVNLNYIKSLKENIIIDCMGGSMYNLLQPLFKDLEIPLKFDYLHANEDPFNHGVGKIMDKDNKFLDWGCDTTIMQVDLATLKIKLPVVETLGYEKLLKDKNIGTIVLITDPDGDRLVTGCIESSSKLSLLESLGLVFIRLSDEKIFVMFTPNQSFLMTFDFQSKSISENGMWSDYNWFIIKTTASQQSWNEWAKFKHVPVVSTPVGFKEIADSMINIEKKMISTTSTDIIIKDVFGNSVNLGTKPRLLFAGEESGGEIFGPSEIIVSKMGRRALSMREKSAGEAIIITAALAGWLESKKLTLLDYFNQILVETKIKSKYEIRLDFKYYNESQPDIKNLIAEKQKGLLTRDLNDSYFLSIALAYKDNIITLDIVKDILTECFPDLRFSDLTDIKFVGDGTFLLFSSKCVEVRPSGTDAINKAYSYGDDRWECISYAQHFTSYTGERTALHKKYIPEDFYKNIKSYSFELYQHYKENQ